MLAARDIEARRRLRMALPDGERSLCAAYTERHTQCRRKAMEGSEYCGQHRKHRSREPRI